MVRERIIQQGAEAVISLNGDAVLKKRVAKSYRLADLDRVLRKRRTRMEARLLNKAARLISVPAVRDVSDFEIEMDFVGGIKLSEGLDSMKNWRKVCLEIGKSIARLHDAGIIHGDLTTSNMIWVEGKLKTSGSKLDSSSTNLVRSKYGNQGNKLDSSSSVGDRLYFIDFGLGFSNGRIEDKAVDLHLIKQALEAKHFENYRKFWNAIVEGYKKSDSSSDVLKRLEKVELRGRYKAQF